MNDSGFFWTGKECPDCGGELEQQDEHNVMCLTCETVFQHILSDAEHVLHHQDLGIAAEEPRLATDGGRSETVSHRWDSALQESDLRHRAQDSWGDVAQLNKASEELSELTAALNRLQNGQQPRDELLKEFIDAKLMMWQLELRFSERELEDALEEELDDLEHRLEVFG